ncbi:hypothetical protein [Agromyces sp. NPDC058104]|uniref:hypothetical protein n=1 Tax=Agromyces sp. NPDC058104 TaxID=3346342 RepID=UPI0036DAC2D2
MDAGWWQVIVAAVSVAVTLLLAWGSSSSARVKRRGEQAQISFDLARELRMMQAAEADRRPTTTPDPATAALVERMDDAARFLASEYSKAVVRVWRAEFTVFSLVYSVILAVYSTWATYQALEYSNGSVWAAVVMMVLSGILLVLGIVGWVSAVNKRSRLRAAGIEVKTLWAEFEGTYRFFHVEFAKSRQRRELRAAAAAARVGE